MSLDPHLTFEKEEENTNTAVLELNKNNSFAMDGHDSHSKEGNLKILNPIIY